jgi:hypothetical protein
VLRCDMVLRCGIALVRLGVFVCFLRLPGQRK